MAQNIRLTRLFLDDKWPGVVNPNLSKPAEGWESTLSNFKTTAAGQEPAYPIGTKIQVYTDNSDCPGYYIMQYLVHHCISSGSCISADYSNGKMWCSHYDGSMAVHYEADESSSPWYVTTRCYTNSTSGLVADTTRTGRLCIPCATLDGDGTGAYVAGYGDSYGWFWVGGVCPCKDATLFQGLAGSTMGADISTDTLMRKGPFFAEISAGVAELMTCDESNILDATAGIAVIASGAKDPACLAAGWVCVSTA